jgi:TolB-like protein/Flp pilus assembly protein TadD/tRNA A-37 threonylcarbamoyl transferase component Bud32
MQPSPQQLLTCPTCGAALEETFGGGGGCMFCLLQAGIGSEEKTMHDSTPDALKGGMRFGVYEIDCHADGNLCELGRGSMGVTYRATDTSLRRKVALKIIKTDIAERSADARERFVREARAAAALRHENIAVIHQFGMRLETGQYFYAMELIEGETLDERVRRAGPLDARTTIGIAQQVTSALAAAEKHGLIHRDLKPANLMLVNADDPEVMKTDQARSKRSRMRALRKSGIPVVKIIDFGLAKAFHTETDPKSLTHDRFVGTPVFASPEQFEHSTLDVRSDIYSLGETLWFALTGKTPFAGRTLSEIHRAQKSNALPVEQLKTAHVPHRLKSLLGSMLAFEPASRPGTGELAARLQRCSQEARKARRTRIALTSAAILTLGMSAHLLVRPSRIQNAALNPAPEKSIAVLPFENLSADEENAFFADGVQDEILTDLAKIADLKVISRTSVMHYKTAVKSNLREVARELGVAHIVEGSVQRTANRVRVSAQLIDARTDMHLWAERYDRDLADVFAIQSEIAQEIADQLRSKVSPVEKGRLQQKPTESGEAYLIYLRAQDRWVRSQSHEDLEQVAQLYLKAIQLDPSFALALARLSCVESTLYQGTANPSSLEKARAAANEAIRLQPGLPEAHLALGYFFYRADRDYERAQRELAVAKAGLPNDADILLVNASIERRQGNWSQSTSDLEKAASVNPKDGSLWANLATNYQALRNFPSAARAFDRGAEADPSFVMNRYLRARLDIDWKGDTSRMEKLLAQTSESQDPDGKITLARYQLKLLQRKYDDALLALTKSRRSDFQGWNGTAPIPKPFLIAQAYSLAQNEVEARGPFEEAQHIIEQRVRENPPDASQHALLGQIFAGLGRKDDAIREGKRAVELLPESKDALDGPIMTLALAQIYTMVGDFASATPLLEHLLTTPGGITVALLKLDPAWDPLRGNPRFEKIVVSFADRR